MDKQAADSIHRGQRWPFDASDEWNENESDPKPSPPPAKDWAHVAARGVMADLEDRRGIKWALEEIDEGVRVDIVQSIAAIIRLAAQGVKL